MCLRWRQRAAGGARPGLLVRRRDPRDGDMVTLIKDGATISVQLSVNGAAAKVDVVVWRRSPEATLLVDHADILAAEVRKRVVQRLPEDVRAEAAGLFDEAALDLALQRAEATQPRAPQMVDPEPWR